MRDRDIRAALLGRLRVQHDDAETRIIEELGLCQGEARVDVAVVNGLLAGYEIKSESDTLDRLPGQLAIYSRALDQVTVVASPTHLARITKMVPIWWGILEALTTEDAIDLQWVRTPAPNPEPDPLAVAQLLWRDEALEALRRLDLTRGVLSKPRRFLWERLVDAVPASQLGAIVRTQLKAREGWRSEQPRLSCGGRSRPGATS